MRVSFFPLIVWPLMLAMAAADEEHFSCDYLRNSPECNALFKGKKELPKLPEYGSLGGVQSVGSTGVYFLYFPFRNHTLNSAHQLCKSLDANLATIRDRAELDVMKSVLMPWRNVWVDVSSSNPSSNRDWYWGNNARMFKGPT